MDAVPSLHQADAGLQDSDHGPGTVTSDIPYSVNHNPDPHPVRREGLSDGWRGFRSTQGGDTEPDHGFVSGAGKLGQWLRMFFWNASHTSGGAGGGHAADLG